METSIRLHDPLKLASIIVIKDSNEDFDTLVQAVCKACFETEVRRATTGDGSLDLHATASALRPTVMPMDPNTLGTDGRDILVAIKRDNILKQVPVSVFSTSADPRDLASCYAAGANAYHGKPVRYPDYFQLGIDLLIRWLRQVALPNVGGAKS